MGMSKDSCTIEAPSPLPAEQVASKAKQTPQDDIGRDEFCA